MPGAPGAWPLRGDSLRALESCCSGNEEKSGMALRPGFEEGPGPGNPAVSLYSLSLVIIRVLWIVVNETRTDSNEIGYALFWHHTSRIS